MHNQLLDYRIKTQKDLKRQAEAYDKANKAKDLRRSKRKSKKEKEMYSLENSVEDDEDLEDSLGNGEGSAEQSWDDMWAIITARTGIAEPGVFFDRMHNGSDLKLQIDNLKEQAEARLEAAKNEFSSVDEELDRSRLRVMNGSTEGDDKTQKLKLIKDEKFLHVIKEKAEAQEQLEQTVKSGLGTSGSCWECPFKTTTPLSRICYATLRPWWTQ